MVEPRKLPVVAIVLASAALVVAIVAIGVLATRGSAPPAAAAEQPVSDERSRFVDVGVDAAEIVKVADTVVARGEGLHVDDTKLRKALELEPDDTLVAFNGRALKLPGDLRDALLDAGLARASTVYVEVARGKEQVLVRWRVSGDLRRAYFDRDMKSARIDPIPVPDPLAIDPAIPAVPADPTDTDALLDKIVKLDDTHVEVPQAVVDALLANPMAFMKGARVVPAMKNGAPTGFKLYAIRPNSPYARLGFMNGDTLKSINGYELTSIDKALEIYTKLTASKKFVMEIERRGRPETLHVTIVK